MDGSPLLAAAEQSIEVVQPEPEHAPAQPTAGFTVPAAGDLRRPRSDAENLFDTSMSALLLRVRMPKLDKVVRTKNVRLLLVGMAGLVASIIQNELLWYSNTCSWQSPEEQEGCIPEVLPESNGSCLRVIEMRPTPISSGLKWLTFGLTILLLMMILDYYRFQLKVERQRLRAPDLQLWHIKRLFVALLAELVVCGLHPLPFLKSLDEDVQVSNPYGFFGESRWTVAMFLRLYLIFRVLRDRYPLYQKRGRLEADLMSKGLPPPRFDWFLSFKATFHTSGPLWLACMVVTIVCCLAYCHSLAEREFQPELFHSGVGFILYYTILLMTAGGPSVGSPCSGWGQAVGMVTCLTGVVLLALTVSVVETKLSLSEKATTALRWDEVDKAVTKERHAAARYIQRLWCASMVGLATCLTAQLAACFDNRSASLGAELRRGCCACSQEAEPRAGAAAAPAQLLQLPPAAGHHALRRLCRPRRGETPTRAHHPGAGLDADGGLVQGAGRGRVRGAGRSV